MAWWNKEQETPAPQQMTVERLESALAAEGYNVGRHESGEYLQAAFNGFNTIFALENDHKMLLVRSWLGTNLDPAEHREKLMDWVNKAHEEQYFPKTYLSLDEDGLQVFAEVYTPCEAGLTDDQIRGLLDVSLDTLVKRLADIQEFLGIQPEISE